MKGPGRYSRRRNSDKTSLEARTEKFEQDCRTCKGKQAGGFHKPGSNKK